MRSRPAVVLAVLGGLLVLGASIVLVPALAAQFSPRGAAHLNTVPDSVLTRFGIVLQKRSANSPGCERLIALTTQAGHGRAATDRVCPGAIDEAAAKRAALAMALPNTTIVETMRADCSLPVYRISHRDCWVLVARGAFRRYDDVATDPLAWASPDASVRARTTSADLAFVDAHTNGVLALIRLTYVRDL